MPLKIDISCVFQHFHRASSHLQLLLLRILQFFTARFYRLLLLMLHSVNLPQQAKKKMPKISTLTALENVFCLHITSLILALSRKTFKFLLYAYLSKKKKGEFAGLTLNNYRWKTNVRSHIYNKGHCSCH